MTELDAQIVIEAGEGLVEQHERRRWRKRSGERHSLAFTAGELVREAITEAGEIDELEELIDAGLALVGAVIAQPEADVVGDGEVREERGSWNTSPAGRRSGGRWSRPSSTSAPARWILPVSIATNPAIEQQRRLAAAARTDQSEKFAGCEFEIDTVDREDVLVGLDDGVEPKRRDGHARWPLGTADATARRPGSSPRR